MARWTARILGLVGAVIGIVGLFFEGSHLLGALNVDLALDIARIVLAAALIAVGYLRVPRIALRAVLLVFGAGSLVVGCVGVADATLAGALPTGLTGLDIGFLLFSGMWAVLAGFMPPGVRNERSELSTDRI